MSSPASKRAAAAGAALFVAALVAWSAWQRWRLLSASPFPIGVDGYFYPIQLRSLLAHGHLAYPASPLTFWLMAPFAAATDPIAGAKLGAAVLGAAVAIPAYGVGARLGGGRGAGILCAALAATSAGSAFMTVEFVKNGIGLGVALAAVWLGLRALEKWSAGRLAAAAAGFVAALLAHKMAAAIAALVLAPAAFAQMRGATRRGALRGRRLLYALAIVGALVVGGLVVGLIAPQRFLSPGDAGLAGGLFASRARWAAPALAAGRTYLPMGHAALIGGVLALVALVARIPAVAALLARAVPARFRRGDADARDPSVRFASYAVIALALFLALPWLDVADRQGLAFRLRAAAFVPMALAAAIAARAVLATLRDRDLVLAVLALALAWRPIDEEQPGEVFVHPAMVAAVQALNGHVPPGDTIVVPERQVMFLATWYTGAPAALHPDAVPRDHRVRLLTRAFIHAHGPLYDALIAARAQPGLEPPLGVHPLDPNGLVLVPEATWDWALAQVPEAQRGAWAAWPTI